MFTVRNVCEYDPRVQFGQSLTWVSFSQLKLVRNMQFTFLNNIPITILLLLPSPVLLGVDKNAVHLYNGVGGVKLPNGYMPEKVWEPLT